MLNEKAKNNLGIIILKYSDGDIELPANVDDLEKIRCVIAYAKEFKNKK